MTRGRQANYALVVDSTGTTDPAERLTEIITRPAAAHSALAAQAQPPQPEQRSLNSDTTTISS